MNKNYKTWGYEREGGRDSSSLKSNANYSIKLSIKHNEKWGGDDLVPHTKEYFIYRLLNPEVSR